MKEQKTITVLGDGGWGTTLAVLLAKKGYRVMCWSAFAEHARLVNKTHHNEMFLKGIRIPSQVVFTHDMGRTLKFSKTIIIAVPSQFLRSVLQRVKACAVRDKVFLSAVKGIEEKTLLRMSEVILDELGRVDLGVLSGPNISHEVASGLPAVSVAASCHAAVSRYFQDLLTTASFRVYTNDDVAGVELGGSLKNIIALACGISDGLGFGSNTKSALLTRGLVEMSRLGMALGARRHTFFGISGLGDLTTTCFSHYSRNRSVGQQIAQGKSLKMILKNMRMVAEGVTTVKAVYKLAQVHSIEMPITHEIYHVLYRSKSPKNAVRDLMLRKKKSEL